MYFHNLHSFSSVTGLDEEGGEDEGGMAARETIKEEYIVTGG